MFKGPPVSSVSILNILFSRAAVEFLYSEGHMYSTIDNEHFKSTDA